MPVDLSHVRLNHPTPIHDQLVADCERLHALQALALLTLDGEARETFAPVVRQPAPLWRDLAALFAPDLLVFATLALAYTSAVLGLALAARP